MPITAIEDHTLHLICALCGAEHTLALDALRPEANTRQRDENDLPDAHDFDALKLPPCPRCDAVESLIRSPDGEPEHPEPGSYGHLHRLLVDHVHEQVHAEPTSTSAASKRAARVGPQSAQKALSAWFPDGLRLEPLGQQDEPPQQQPHQGELS